MARIWTLLFLLSVPALGQDGEKEAAEEGLDSLGGLFEDHDEATGDAEPIDFDSIERKIGKLPPLVAEEPLYGLFLFGMHGEKRAWAVLDKTAKTAEGYDVLYFDLDADGDLTAARERFTADERGAFAIGSFRDPGTGAVHKEFKVTWTPASIRYTMLWRGGRKTMGAYGPERSTYNQFAPTVAEAPIFVPGWDRPLEFEHWMSGTLQRGGATDFKVFVGARGSRTGGFSAVDDAFLPRDEYVQATLVYTDGNGKRQRFMAKLMERC